jgi:hypothetical protein
LSVCCVFHAILKLAARRIVHQKVSEIKLRTPL